MSYELIFCKVKIEFTFISEERLRLFESQERSNRMRPKYIKTIFICLDQKWEGLERSDLHLDNNLKQAN